MENSTQAPLSISQVDRTLFKKVNSLIGGNATVAAVALAAYRESCRQNREIRYSRSAGFYDIPPRYRDRNFTFKKVVSSIDYLAEESLIENTIMPSGTRGWQSYFKVEQRLSDILAAEIDDFSLSLPPSMETIFLKGEDGKLVNYKDTKATYAMRRDVVAHNEAIKATTILDGNGHLIGASCRRIFIGDFTRFGRIYAGGDSWQNMSNRSGERRLITINGEATYEVDFRSMAANMLIVEAGMPAMVDAYDIADFWHRVVIDPVSGFETDVGRGLVKLAFQVITNSQSHQEALLCIANLDQMTAFAPDAADGERMALASRLIRDMKSAHPKIVGNFFKGVCARLQKSDSDIATDVLKLCRKQGVIALPIHDSFLVQRSAVDILEEAMAKAAEMNGYGGLLFKRS